MAITVQDGWLKGHAIRKARKDYSCEYFRGAGRGGLCKAPIKVGELYVEGEMSERAGGFGHDRYCLTCAEVTAAGQTVTGAA